MNIINKAIVNNDLQKFNIFSQININNIKSDKKLKFLFDSKAKTKNSLNNKNILFKIKSFFK